MNIVGVEWDWDAGWWTKGEGDGWFVVLQV